MTRPPASPRERFLYEACTVYGFCLPPGDQAKVLAADAADPATLVDMVILLEGLEPSVCRWRDDLLEAARRCGLD
ncbi:hypothetical protein JQC91_02745 [Jannaschia sp. Os4]|uniref:hypothetical protein n=1 Tax=Jannaschia sp. Os4 TaxID=2807617 RepID=UPI00193AB32C|nr:hypothetical protein [Jannaschia sp. Os4]MBM2575213.1 hypothetical protein [Jannaschia sp. Os4]